MNSRRMLSRQGDILIAPDLLRQLVVGLLELADGLFEVGAQPVERLAELLDFVRLALALADVLAGKVELAHAVGERRHGNERPGKLAREEKREHKADEQGAAACDQQEHEVERGVLLDECERHIGDEVAALVRVERADEAEILVVVAQTDVGEAVLMHVERGPVRVLHDRGEHRDTAELLLIHTEIEPRHAAFVAVMEKRRGENRAVVHHHGESDGGAALVAVEHGHDVVRVAGIAGADRVEGVAQAVFSRHHEIVLVEEQVEDEQQADKDERDQTDGGEKLEADGMRFQLHPSKRYP